jgi:uncharacterized protein YkwD
MNMKVLWQRSIIILGLMVLLGGCGQSDLELTPPNKVTPASGDVLPGTLELLMLTGINHLRSSGLTCQNTYYPPAETLSWNMMLSGASKTHVKNLLLRQSQGEFDLSHSAPPHTDAEGNRVNDRVTAQGYDFSLVGENLASVSDGSASVLEVIASWKASLLGHCEALMLGEFEEVGLYFEGGIWAAVFAKPR